jgi:predicted transposase/invertase (TIGR01784 family)
MKPNTAAASASPAAAPPDAAPPDAISAVAAAKAAKSRYIELTTDFGFKRIFGQEANADLLIDFLNSMLPKDHQIASLRFRVKENVGHVKTASVVLFDIFCQTSDGRYFIVEMQRATQMRFLERAIYYISCVIRDQDPRPEDTTEAEAYTLLPVYFIGILEKDYDNPQSGNRRETTYKRPAFKNRLLLRNIDLRDDDDVRVSETINIIIAQLPLADPTNVEQCAKYGDHIVKWLYLLNHIESFSVIPSLFPETVFQRTAELAERAQLSTAEYNAYLRSLDVKIGNEAAIANAIATGIDKGIAEAEAKGRAEGATEKAIETARKMNADGLPADVIAKYTNLTPEQISQL